MKKLDQALKDVDYYRQVNICFQKNFDDLILAFRKLRIFELGTTTWSWKTRGLTRKLWVSDGEFLSHLVSRNISLGNFPDSSTRTAKKCPSSGDNTRNFWVRRAAQVSPWASCTELCSENTRQSKMTSVSWVKGEVASMNKYIQPRWLINWKISRKFFQ